MPFIRLTTDFVRDARVKELASRLNIPPVQAVGHLVSLASALAEQGSDGNLIDLPPFLIAEYSEWPGGAMDFTNALDNIFSDDRFPDWDSVNQPQREAAASAKRQRRKRANVTANKKGSHAKLTDEQHEEIKVAYKLAWENYPKRPGNSRLDGLEQFVKRVKEGVNPWDMVAGVNAYKKYCDAVGSTGTQYVKEAATFFGPKRHWESDFTIPASAKGNGKAPQQYSYEEELGPAHPNERTVPMPAFQGSPTVERTLHHQTVTVAGDPTPRLVGREGSLEITERDEPPEPEKSPYGRRVE